MIISFLSPSLILFCLIFVYLYVILTIFIQLMAEYPRPLCKRRQWVFNAIYQTEGRRTDGHKPEAG